MNAQEIYDTVAKHLFTQGRQASDVDGCAYRAPDGATCAVGCLLPDEAYDPEMEGMGVYLLTELCSDKLPSWFPEHESLLSSLQLVHDNCVVTDDMTRTFNLQDLEDRFRDVAHVNQLSDEIIDTLVSNQPKEA